MTRLLASLILCEGAFTVLWLASRLPVLAAYGPPTLVILGLRALVASALITGAYLLLARRPPGAPIARGALLGSAALTTAEIGLRLAPSNLDPTFAWPVVALYWAYALAAWWYLRGPRASRT